MNKGRLPHNLYGNILLIGVEGKELGRLGYNQANFYVNNKLVKILETNELNQPTKIQLLFKEKGPGKNGDLFFLSERKNQCVVCGSNEDLYRTYILPKVFRNHFPDHYRLHNEYDIMLTCRLHHNIYSNLIQFEIKKYRDQFNIKEELEKLPQRLKLAKKAAHALTKCWEYLPDYVIEQKWKILEENIDPKIRSYGSEAIKSIANLNDYYAPLHYKHWAKTVVDRFKSTHKVNNMLISFRLFFVMSMSPKYLSEFWNVYSHLVNK